MTDMEKLQSKLFKQIIDLNGNTSVVAVLGELLNLERGAIYKRMNGSTLLRFDEIVKLCQHFNLSLDTLILSHSTSLSFEAKHLDLEVSSSLDVLEYLYQVFDTIKNEDGNELVFLSNDLPFFHYFSFPILFQVKLWMWQNTSFTKSAFEAHSQLTSAHLSKREVDLLSLFIKDFNNHPIIEIWSPNIFEDLFSQMLFLVLTNRVIERGFLDNFCSSLRLLINHLKHISSTGLKKIPGASDDRSQLRVYVNNLKLGSPLLYHRSSTEEVCFLIFNSPNFIKTRDKQFCRHISAMLHRIRGYSINISQDGTRDRIKYFSDIELRFENFKKDIYAAFEFSQNI